ncbi:MAG: hypothetical protein AB7F97_09095 [Solirubrobacterales bacterium]
MKALNGRKPFADAESGRSMKNAEQVAPRHEISTEAPPSPPPLPGWIVASARWAKFHLGRTVKGIWSHSGAPSVIFGAGLLFAALVLFPGSTWTLTIFVLGSALVTVGLLGPRLRVALGMRWHQDGLNINFDLGVDARSSTRGEERAIGSGAQTGSALILPAGIERPAPSVAEELEVIEGSAETMEFSSVASS